MKVETSCWLFRYLFLIRKSFVNNDWNNVERINCLQIWKKIDVAFIFREISSIVYNFSFCCELQRCRELPTWIFLLCFSTNRHIWRIVRLFCKLKTFSNFANSDFSVLLHESAHLVAFGTILRISKICKLANFFLFLATLIHLAIFGTILQVSKICEFGKLEFFHIPQRVGTLSDVWGQFVNFRNLQQFTSFFFREFFYFDRWNLCKNRGVD